MMTDYQREIRHKLRVLEYVELSEDVRKTCRHFGVGEPVSTDGVIPIGPTPKLG